MRRILAALLMYTGPWLALAATCYALYAAGARSATPAAYRRGRADGLAQHLALPVEQVCVEVGLTMGEAATPTRTECMGYAEVGELARREMRYRRTSAAVREVGR